ncbi:MAG: hypothetical protein AAF329_10530 [Cyanobacteria bacterium P01_A01_bin.17]
MRNGWFIGVAIATTLTIILGTGHRSLLSIDSAAAQRIDPREVAAQVYQQQPELPLENQYVRKRSRKAVESSTLVSRLIEYHTLTKGRSPRFRLDWKFTFADYLGLNEYLVEKKYPGHAYLKSSPMEQDQAIIQSFNRQQRADLIQALVDLHTVGTATVPAEPPPAPATSESAVPQPRPQPSQDADLLRVTPPATSPQPTGASRLLLPQ